VYYAWQLAVSVSKGSTGHVHSYVNVKHLSYILSLPELFEVFEAFETISRDTILKTKI
jgi:hypothetical protein